MCYANAQPILIIGQDNSNLLLSKKSIYSTDNNPILTKTPLGWVAHGRLNQEPTNEYFSFHVYDSKIRNDDDLDVLQNLLKEQWKFDTRGIETNIDYGLSAEDKTSIEILEKKLI